MTGGQLFTTNTAVTAAQTTANAAKASADTATTTAASAKTAAAAALDLAQQDQQQIQALSGQISGLDSRLTSLEGRVAKVEKNVDATAAMSAAMNNASMPNLLAGEKAVVAGLGTSGGQSAVSVGIVIATIGGNSFGAKAAFTTVGKATFGVGGGVKF